VLKETVYKSILFSRFIGTKTLIMKSDEIINIIAKVAPLHATETLGGQEV
jgi:hypothetical protein